MSANHLYHLDKNLKDCYQYDFDWSLLPDNLRKMCTLFAKALKQRDTSILFGVIVLASFCMGHACVNVQNAFWKEPVIIWIASVITTGRCKSAFHEFLSDILELVADRVEVHEVKAKQMVLPHCTWDKFGELLAESGGRSLGLFDELMSFFSTMNMYSSHKLQISDTREYQDFLQLFTGKAKTRETVTGNANFNIARTSFSFMGFTQPHAALPVIQDTSNNAKGFTSRILWYFPQPVFAKFEDTILTKEENDLAQQLREKLVDWLADLYMHGESTFQILEQGKMKSVSVTHTEYSLTEDAIKEFTVIHDEWELDVCEKNPYDPLLGGIYSRGKSHVLRLSVPIQLLLAEFEAKEETEDSNLQDIHDANNGEKSDSDNLNIDQSCDFNNEEEDYNEDVNEETSDCQVPTPLTEINWSTGNSSGPRTCQYLPVAIVYP